MGGDAGSLVQFRGEMLRSIAAYGHEVLALAPDNDPGIGATLGSMGVAYQTVPLYRTGTNPLRDGSTVAWLARTFRRFQADAPRRHSPRDR